MTQPATGYLRPLLLGNLRYFLRLALHSFRRDRLLTVSIILTLGVGIAASMTVFSILHVLAGDPIPEKSARLFQPTITDGGPSLVERPHLYSMADARDLIEQLRPPERGAVIAQGFSASVGIPGGHQHQSPLVRFTSAPFFALFDISFLEGGPWSPSADATGDHVVVLTSPIARELFGSASALGKLVTLGGLSVRVVGVMDDWHPIPRFYDRTPGAYTPADNVYVPLQTIRDMNSQVFVSWNCADAAAVKDIQNGHFGPLLGPKCAWVTLWTEIPSAQGYRRIEGYLAQFLAQLKKSGRALPEASSSLPDVLQSLKNAHVVPGDIRAYTVMGFLFLWLCVLSATGTLLGKFLRRSPEIGVRRALGASRSDVLAQFLVEAGLLGVASGIFGLLLAELSLIAIRHSPSYLSQVVGMSAPLLAFTLSLSVLSGILAGLLPAWRAAHADIGVIIKVD